LRARCPFASLSKASACVGLLDLDPQESLASWWTRKNSKLFEVDATTEALTGLGGPTNKEAVAAAERAADTATSNQTAESDKRGPLTT
jgi:cellulose biosynthesis protein BcsQ